MCRVSKEAVIRANSSTKNTTAMHSDFAANDVMNISIRYNGNVYSKQITIKEAKTSFAKAMNDYGKKL
jgi:hypothetical protein